MAGLWKKEYELNLKEIDAQHRKFFTMLEEAEHFKEKKELSGEDVFQIFRLIMGLRTYGYYHFHSEEKLMVEAGFPEFLDHMDRHDEFINSLNQFRRDFLVLFQAHKAGEENAEEIQGFFRKLFDYVLAWYQQHISTEDAKYAYFIKKKA